MISYSAHWATQSAEEDDVKLSGFVLDSVQTLRFIGALTQCFTCWRPTMPCSIAAHIFGRAVGIQRVLVMHKAAIRVFTFRGHLDDCGHLAKQIPTDVTSEHQWTGLPRQRGIQRLNTMRHPAVDTKVIFCRALLCWVSHNFKTNFQ